MIVHFEENKEGKDYIVGDIHGCFYLLKEKLIEVGFNEKTDRLFSVGDLVDRGPDSISCYKWLDKPWFHAVRGNHEQIPIEYIHGTWPADNYISNGGSWFLGLTEDEQLAFVDMFESLPIVITVDTKFGKVGIIHADCPVHDWNELNDSLHNNKYAIEYCIWGRVRINDNDDTPIDNIWRVYHGHSIVEDREQYGNVHFIDTGAFHTKKLTLVEITDD